jgi:hypothetical protein
MAAGVASNVRKTFVDDFDYALRGGNTYRFHLSVEMHSNAETSGPVSLHDQRQLSAVQRAGLVRSTPGYLSGTVPIGAAFGTVDRFNRLLEFANRLPAGLGS